MAKSLMGEIFDGPDSVMGRIFDGKESLMGRVFGDSETFETPVPLIRIRLNQKKLDRLRAGGELSFQADDRIIRLVMEGTADAI